MPLSLAVILAASLVPPISSANPVQNSPLNQLMGGDERLACEAIMCLSNPSSQPTQCDTALKKFFSIKHKYGHDTVTARRNFLRKCPASDRSGLDDFIDTLVK